MWAAGCGQTQVLVLLLEHGAAIDLKNDAGDTALLCAVTEGHTECARLLIESNHLASDPQSYLNHTTSDGDTALLISCHLGNQDIAIDLIKAGADVNKRDSIDKATPLQIAKREGLVRVVNKLRLNGGIL
jgi:ankyrin repeat protein